MKLAAFKTAIDATLGGLAGKVTKARHKTANDVIADEIFSVGVLDSNITETYTTKAGATITYSLLLKKTGNETLMRISLRNITGATIPGSSSFMRKIFDWKDTDFKPSTTNDINFPVYNVGGSYVAYLFINDVGVFLTSSLPPTSVLVSPYQSEFVKFLNPQL